MSPVYLIQLNDFLFYSQGWKAMWEGLKAGWQAFSTNASLGIKWWQVWKSPFLNAYNNASQVSTQASQSASSAVSWFPKLVKWANIAGYAIAVIGLAVNFGLIAYSAWQIYDSLGGEFGFQVALAYATFQSIYTVALFMIGLVPKVGWVVVLAISVFDVMLKIISGKTMVEWLTHWYIKATTKTEPRATLDLEVGENETSIVDPGDTGLTPGDIITLLTEITETVCFPREDIGTHRSKIEAKYEIGQPTYVGFEATSTSTRSVDYHVDPDHPGTGNQDYWWLKDCTNNARVTLKPKTYGINSIAQIIFHADASVEYDFCYRLWYTLWILRKCERKIAKNTKDVELRLYLDVLPATIDRFMSWIKVIPLDEDGDGRRFNDEIAPYGQLWIMTDPKRWDTDSDGLGDRFEKEMGMHPLKSDTDGDGLMDGIEVLIGTDPNTSDTDGDGLSDYMEYCGWYVSFKYGGKTFIERVWPDPLLPDSDTDSLSDMQEYDLLLNPMSSDTDGNGIFDAESTGLPFDPNELNNVDMDNDGLIGSEEIDGWNITVSDPSSTQTIHVTSDPALKDTDGDGVSDGEEFILGSNPRKPDTDNDGLSDIAERELGTNIADHDTDGDGLDDGAELTLGSDPEKSDTDYDGLTDSEEQVLGTNPLSQDTDGDGLTDLQERNQGTDPLNWDSDNDLLSDKEEIALGTDPWNQDSDNDGLTDGHEISLGTNPMNSDTDGDDLNDSQEIELLTDPLIADSDSDGLTDSEELEYGTNPNSTDTDADGVEDIMDPDTIAPHVSPIIVVFDEYQDGINQFVEGLRQYTEVIVGTPDEVNSQLGDKGWINIWQQFPGNIVVIGMPNDQLGKEAGNFTFEALPEEIRAQMAESDSFRFAVKSRGVSSWTLPPDIPTPPSWYFEDQVAVMLTRPYSGDHWLTLGMFKSIKWEIDDNEVSRNYSYNQDYFGVDAIDKIGFFFDVKLTEVVSPYFRILRCSPNTTPHLLTSENGLQAGYVATGKYIDIAVNEAVQSDDKDIIDHALLKIYYSAFDLDGTPGKDGDCTDGGDIDENTLCLYVWDESAGQWVKLTRELDWVNDTGLDTTNVQPHDKPYEGYVWADVGHFSLYALAGRPRTIDVQSVSPASNASDIPLDTIMTATFNSDVAAVDLSGIFISNATGVFGILNEASNTLTIYHDEFISGVTYVVTIPAGSVQDSYGSPNREYRWSFTTISSPPLVPSIFLCGNIAMAILLGIAIVWAIRRRQIRSRMH